MTQSIDSQTEIPPDLGARDLLTSVHSRLEGLRTARAVYAKRLAPEFNVLSLLRLDELRLSSLLAELLDPAGRHETILGVAALSCEEEKSAEFLSA